MAVKQYPHTLVFTTAGTEATFNEDSQLVPGEPGEEVMQACRYEESSSRGDATVKGVDNETYRQAGIIYLPKSAAYVPEAGTEVTVLLAGQDNGLPQALPLALGAGEEIIMFTGRITQPYRGQLNTTIKAY